MISRSSDFRSKNQPKIKLVEAENDFPVAKVTQVVVGSAHAVTNDPRIESALKQLLHKLVDHFHGLGEVPDIEIENKLVEKQP